MASDDFNRADGGLGGNWTTQVGTAPAISGNRVFGGAFDDASVFWNTGTWDDDQESQVTYVVEHVGSLEGPGVRHSGTGAGASGYVLVCNYSNLNALYRLSGGSYTFLATMTGFPAVGSVLKVGVVGTQITAYDDGGSMGSTSDGTIASGNPGFYINGTAGALDDWSGVGDAVSPRFILGTH